MLSHNRRKPSFMHVVGQELHREPEVGVWTSLREYRYDRRTTMRFVRDVVAPRIREGKVYGIAGGYANQSHCLSRIKPGTNDLGMDNYKCPDVDVFHPNNAMAADDERVFLDEVDCLRANAIKAGHVITGESYSRRAYGSTDEFLYIKDFTVQGLHSKLSFICCPGTPTVEEVVSRFDIDVAKVMVDVKTGAHKLDPLVANAIDSRKATVSPFVFSSYDVPVSKGNRLLCTAHRMRKYSDTKGYTFDQYPDVVCTGKVAGRRRRPIGLRMVDEERRTNRIRRTFDRTTDMLWNVIPHEDLLSGKVGLVGDFVLSRYLCDTPSAGYTTLEEDTALVFVCGDKAATKTDFENYVDGTVVPALLNQYDPAHGLHPRNGFAFTLNSVHRRLPAYKIEFTQQQELPALVFVMCNGMNEVTEAMMQFPTTASSVAWDFQRQQVFAPPEIESSLRYGRIEVRDVVFQTLSPAVEEVDYLREVLVSMRYYSYYGLRIANYPQLIALSAF